VRAYASRERSLRLRDGTELTARPLAELEPADLLLHFAFLTRERGKEAGYLRDNLAITLRVLDAIEQRPPHGLVYLSSGAARWRRGVDADPYGALKRVDELTLRQASRDAGARCAVLRVFNIGGPYMTKAWGYALGDLIARVSAGEELTIRSARPVRRSYLLARDVVAVGLAWLLDAGAGADVVLDAAGEESVEIGELTERVKRVLGQPDLPVRRDWDPGAAPDNYVGDGEAFAALARRLGIGLSGLDDVIAATAADLNRSDSD
jgi:nucleoside-diphosphate-sugar epimerase